jgi:hypothetical protein
VAALLDVLLFLVFIAIPGAALVMQSVPLRLGDVTFHDTDPPHAWAIVSQYAAGTFEQRFGYPTGYFYLDEKRSQQPTRMLIREAQPAGAVTDGCSLQISSMSLSGFEGGCGPGCMMFFAVAFIGAPFLLVSTFDRFFRFLLRSRVDVHLEASGPDAVAAFAFYGIGGYSLRRRYAQVFERPALPAALSAEAVASPWSTDGEPGKHRDRA